MKTLIAYYSRSGNTKKVAELIAKNLDAEIEEIVDKKSRKGVIGWLSGGKDAFKKKPTDINFKKKADNYDLVIIGTPVWAGTMAPAIRTYVSIHKPKKVAFLCTYGGGVSKTFTELEELTTKPIATLGLKDKDIDENKIKEFCDQIKSTLG